MDLDLSANHLAYNTSTVLDLLAALSRTLRSVELESCRFDSSHIERLTASLADLPHLQFLNLSGNLFRLVFSGQGVGARRGVLLVE